MRAIVRGVAVVGAFLILTGCTAGSVVDKRAIGEPGNKIFQLRVSGFLPDRWVTVSEDKWDKCWLNEPYSGCED